GIISPGNRTSTGTITDMHRALAALPRRAGRRPDIAARRRLPGRVCPTPNQSCHNMKTHHVSQSVPRRLGARLAVFAVLALLAALILYGQSWLYGEPSAVVAESAISDGIVHARTAGHR